MTPAEVWFLRAEAALRGWSSESVKDCYEKGVKASFAQWGAAVPKHIWRVIESHPTM